MSRTPFSTFYLPGARVAARWVRAVVAAPAGGLLAAGCGAGELEGQYFDVRATATENLCTGSGTSYSDNFEYRLIVAGNDLQLAIEDDIFATGTIEGCTLSYSSIAWKDYRDDAEIVWQIIGSARANLGGGAGCLEGSDWEGDEQFVIITSEHPDVQPGCTYSLHLIGTFLREVGGDDDPETVDPVQ